MKALNLVIHGAANPHVAILHYPEIRGAEYVNLLAVSDTDEARLKAAERFFRGHRAPPCFYRNAGEMYAKHPEAEAVMIGSDNCDHLPHTLEALAMGKHILSMKNVSLDEDECREMMRAARHAGRILQVELILHFEPRYRHLLRLVTTGAVGTVRALYITNVSHCPVNYYPNWGVPECVYGKRVPLRCGSRVCRGGAVTDHPHPFDLARMFSGSEFKSIYAMSAPNIRDTLEVEDHAAVTAEMHNGVQVFINPSYSNLEVRAAERGFIWPKSLDCLVKVYGDRGVLFSDFREKPNLMVSGRGIARNRFFADARRTCMSFGDSLLSSFLLSCREKRKVESGGFDGLQATRAINAVYNSIFHNCVIELEKEHAPAH